MVQTFQVWLARRRQRRARYRRHYALFDEAVAEEGRRLEALDPNALRPLDGTGLTRTVGGVSCRIAIETRDAPDGAVYVCLDAHGLGRWRRQPGRHFTKHPNGTVTYEGAP